jgi:hypothetical protein
MEQEHDMIPKGWGEPSPVFNFCTMEYETGGIVWIPAEPAAPENIQDAISWVGVENIDWPTAFNLPSYRDRKLESNPGGCYSGRKNP